MIYLLEIDVEMMHVAEEYLEVASNWAIQAGLATISGMLALTFIISIFRE